MPLVFFIITSLFSCVMLPLLPYMKCLLYGYNNLNNLCSACATAKEPRGGKGGGKAAA